MDAQQTITSQKHSTSEEIRMKWFMLYFVTSISAALIIIILVAFFITKSPFTLTGFSLPSGLLLQVLRHLFPTKVRG